MPDFHTQKATHHDGVKATRKSSSMIYTFTRHLVMKVGHERVSSIDISQDTGPENQIQILKRY